MRPSWVHGFFWHTGGHGGLEFMDTYTFTNRTVALNWIWYLYTHNLINESQYWSDWNTLLTGASPSIMDYTIKHYPEEFQKWITKHRLMGLPV